MVEAGLCSLMSETPTRRTVSSTMVTSLNLTPIRLAVRSSSALDDLIQCRYTAAKLKAQDSLGSLTYQEVHFYLAGGIQDKSTFFRALLSLGTISKCFFIT